MSERQRHATSLFAPLAPTYDRVGAVLSFGQDPRWRRFMVSRLPADGGTVLDVATGTGLVAARLLDRGFRVTGLDQSPDMLAAARKRFGGRVELVEASATALALRGRLVRPPHVHLPAPLRRRPRRDAARAGTGGAPGRHDGRARVRRAARRLAAALGLQYVNVGLPLAGRLISPGWREVGTFLGPSIRASTSGCRSNGSWSSGARPGYATYGPPHEPRGWGRDLGDARVRPRRQFPVRR